MCESILVCRHMRSTMFAVGNFAAGGGGGLIARDTGVWYATHLDRRRPGTASLLRPETDLAQVKLRAKLHPIGYIRFAAATCKGARRGR